MSTDTKQLIASVLLQRWNEHNLADFVDRIEIDATEILALPADRVRDVIRDFDEDRGAQLENLPVREAEALSAAHGGPTEVSLNLTSYLIDIGAITWDQPDGDDWLTEDVLAKAREAAGFAPKEPTDGQVFRIAKEYVAVAFDGRTWKPVATADTLEEAEMQLGLADAPKP